MTKYDITLDRSMTLNTGNFSSIKPSVSITIKDIDKNKIDEEYKKLSNVLDAMLALETISISEEMGSALSMGHKEYVKNLENAKNNMERVINDYTNESFSI